MADSQSGHDSSTDSPVMENKQTTETLEVVLQRLKLYLAIFFLNKCVHVQLEAFLFH